MLDYAVPFLICFPFLISVFLLLSGKNKAIGNALARIGAVVILITSVAFFAAQGINRSFETASLFTDTEIADYVILGGEVLLVVVVVFLCFKYKKYWISLLSVIPTVAIIYVEETAAKEEMAHIFLDKLAMIMILLVGVIGSLIIYMQSDTWKVITNTIKKCRTEELISSHFFLCSWVRCSVS